MSFLSNEIDAPRFSVVILDAPYLGSRKLGLAANKKVGGEFIELPTDLIL